jgi:hypothetical protein
MCRRVGDNADAVFGIAQGWACRFERPSVQGGRDEHVEDWQTRSRQGMFMSCIPFMLNALSLQVNLVAIDIFNGRKYEDMCPSTHNVDVPVVKRKDYEVCMRARVE